jgi:hypothetical protein
MKKVLPLALVAAAALPVFASDFGSGVDVGGIRGQARASAADAAQPAPAPWAPYASEPALPAVAPERLAALMGGASDWPARKADAKEALDTLVESRIRSGDDEGHWRWFGERVWQLAQDAEVEQDILYSRVYDKISSETSDPDERRTRLAAAADLARFRKYSIYGNMIPRVIDESHQNAQGQFDGRLSAGPRWVLVMTWDEAQSVNRVLITQTHILPDDYEAMGKDVAKQYAAANPRPPEPGRP